MTTDDRTIDQRREDLLDAAIANMPSHGTYDYKGIIDDVPPGTVAVWQTNPANPSHPIRDYEVARRLAEDHPEYVHWRFDQRCDVCGDYFTPGTTCACNLVPDQWAETPKIVQELRETMVALRHCAEVTALLAARHNIAVLATEADEAAAEISRLLREHLPVSPAEWPPEAVERLLTVVDEEGVRWASEQ